MTTLALAVTTLFPSIVKAESGLSEMGGFSAYENEFGIGIVTGVLLFIIIPLLLVSFIIIFIISLRRTINSEKKK